MKNNLNITSQKQILYDLLESTCLDYCATPEKQEGDIVIGANKTTFSLRNDGMGILSGSIARAVLPAEDTPLQNPEISKYYELEPLFCVYVFELYAFRQGECALLRYEKGERKLFSVYPDSAQDGILVHLEWDTALIEERIITKEDVTAVLRRLLVGNTPPYRLSWKPKVWFNGKLIW
ncbi:MAG: hypothetical protein IKV62_08705 [Bacteroidales bacterium]|nr:hypothetical protein [Bacteroidales bacterium]